MSKEEEEMLNGEQGEVVQEAMEFLVRIGDANKAEGMVDVSYAHIMASDITFTGHKLASTLTRGSNFKIPTTLHALHFNLDYLDRMGLSTERLAESREEVLYLKKLHERLGTIPISTCQPYYVFPIRFGDHIALTDTTVVPIANSWYGARTNMETPISAVACAITGKTPKCGLHLRENRLGGFIVDIEPELHSESFDYADYGAIAYWVSRLLIDGSSEIPVYKGLYRGLTLAMVKNMYHMWYGGASMFHILGVTPEAKTLEYATGGIRITEKIHIDKTDLEEAYQALTTASDEHVDIVSLGCPHATIPELIYISGLLKNKEIYKDTQLWVGTSHSTWSLAKKMGIVDIIEGAGGLLIPGACVCASPLYAVGPQTVATNSGSLSQIINSRSGKKGSIGIWFGRTSNCINAAIEGNWEVN